MYVYVDLSWLIVNFIHVINFIKRQKKHDKKYFESLLFIYIFFECIYTKFCIMEENLIFHKKP